MAQAALLDGSAINRINIEGSVDLHFHFRNPAEDGDGRTELLMQAIAHEHEVAVGIGNCVPPITNRHGAIAYKEKLDRFKPADADLMILVAPLMTDKTTPEMIREMRQHPLDPVAFIKVFFEGVSNDGGMSVSDHQLVHDALKATYDGSVNAPPLSVHFHAERKFERGHTDEKDYRIPMLEREWYCVNNDIREIVETHPDGVFVLKHITDLRTVAFIHETRKRGIKIFGEIAAQYLAQCFDDLWEGPGNKGTSLRANDIRWPLPKDRRSQLAIIEAALSDGDGFLFGSDCAWHIDDPSKEGGVKVTCDYVVCGGLAILPAVSMSIIIDKFIKAGKTEDDVNKFLSRRARALLGLPPARRLTTYVRSEWTIGTTVESEPDSNRPIRVRLFMGGETCAWRREVATEQ